MLNTSAAAADLTQLSDVFSGLAGCNRVAVAVSGGSDSMALLHLVVEWVRTSDVQLVALTVDHGLRATSADEAMQVSQWCAALKISHYVLPWLGEKPTRGIQAAARVARYDLMGDWCRSCGFDVLLTAHTMDDQAETVVMRRLRTSSDKSLAGIWPEMSWQGVRVVRPLLFLLRADLRDALRHRGQTWIDDPSNEDERFERVRIRKAMTPSEILGLADVARRAQAATLDTVRGSSDFFNRSVILDEFGCFTFQRNAFVAEDPDVAREALARAVHIAGSGVWPARDGVSALVDWITGGTVGRRTLAGAVVAVRKKVVLVAREAGRIAPEWTSAARAGLWDGRFEIDAPMGSLVGPAVLVSGVRGVKNVARFVQDGLPAVKLPEGKVILAHEGKKIGISAMFRERIWF